MFRPHKWSRRVGSEPGQQQLRQSVRLMMPCGVIPQHCAFYIHTASNTHTHTNMLHTQTHTHTHTHNTHTHTHTHTQHTRTHTRGFSSPPHSNLLPVWELSSSRLDWQKLNKMPFFSQPPPYLPLASPPPPGEEASTCPGRSSRRRRWSAEPASLRRSTAAPPALPCPVVPAVSIRQPARFARRAALAEPRCLSGAPLSSFRAPCNKKSRLWRHTMWKGGRFKKEKNASKNNKSQL